MAARRGPLTRRGASGLVLAAAGAALVASAVAVRAPTPPVAMSSGGPPAPALPAFTPGPPRRLGSTRHLSHWAPVERATAARSAAAASAPVVAGLPTRTPEGTRNTVAVLERTRDRSGRRWVRVSLAVLPNGTTGWVPRSALGGYGTVRTRLDVDRARLRATLHRNGRAVFTAAVGVGTASSPTPAGRFYVRNRLVRYRSATYGPIAFGTSARSPTATGWPAGGFVGIHGTDRPDLLPGRVSRGCIRMRNADIRALARRMPIGTPVTVH